MTSTVKIPILYVYIIHVYVFIFNVSIILVDIVMHCKGTLMNCII